MTCLPLRILIVEDQFLIAKQLELIVAAEGHLVVGTCDNSEAACALARATRPDIAFVDVSLSDGATGLDVATYITEHCSAHVVFTTANRRRVPPDFCGAIGVVEKPFTRVGLGSAINYITARVRETRGLRIKPESLSLSPHYSARWCV